MSLTDSTPPRRRTAFVVTTALLACLAIRPAGACTPLGHTGAELLTGPDGQFVVPAETDPDALAVALVACLGNADPELRDAVGYTGLATLLRSGAVDAAVVRQLRTKLLDQLARGDESGDGFLEPFTALALAEVARVDRITPLFTPAERAELVAAASAWIEGIRDYRGYSDAEGWRHGVAHGADLLLQLVLNPALDDAQVRRIVAATLSQVRATDGHAYIYGESRRLARPVLFAAQRDVLTAGEWQTLFDGVAEPPGERWAAAFESSDQLAVLRNVRGFFLNVYASVAESDQAEFAGIREAARAVLGTLP